MSDTFGGRLRKVRKQFGLTQKLFGEQLLVSLPTINRLEQSDVWPHEEFLLRLRTKFDCDPSWILTGEGDQKGLTGAVSVSDVKRDRHVHNFLETQRKEWLEIVSCSEQILLLAPEKERREAETRIRMYREKIDYINALLEVGRNEKVEENGNS